ncbi:MAG: hypothetical protein EOP06_17195, partial [Proteobacteria bacterium]
MKTYYLLSLMLVSAFSVQAQTVLSSTSFELRKPVEEQQLLSAEHPENGDFYVFASDRNRIITFKYNSALFLRDSLSSVRPNSNFSNLVGYSFSDRTAYTYWASEDFTRIMGVGHNLENRAVSSTVFAYSYDKDTFVNAFSQDGSFYLVTVADEKDQLNISIFK